MPQLKVLASLVFLLWVAGPSGAQLAELLHDYRTNLDFRNLGSSPVSFVALDDVTVFLTGNHDVPRELWRTDGTPEGTYALLNGCLGHCRIEPDSVVRLGNSVVGRTSRHSDPYGPDWELWATDGTRDGTRTILQSVFPSRFSRFEYAVLGEQLFFANSEPNTGEELWVTDGTAHGTRLFKDLTPGVAATKPSGFNQGEGLFYFFTGTLPWRSDGTPEGTFPVYGELTFFAVDHHLVVGDRLFFTASNFVTDTNSLHVAGPGLEEGTEIVTQPRQQAASQIATDGEKVYTVFADDSGARNLWVSDGSIEGSRVLTHFEGSDEFTSWRTTSLAAAGSSTVFLVEGEGRQLWRTNGTLDTTEPLFGCEDLPCVSVRSRALAAAGDRVLFAGEHPDHGTGTWVTDGTAEGTQILTAPGVIVNSRHEPGGSLVFSDGEQLWRTNGLPESLERLTNFSAPINAFPSDGNGFARTPHGYVLGVFDPDIGHEPWVSGSPNDPPTLLADINRASGSAFPSGLFPFADKVAASLETGREFRTVATDGETIALLDFLPSGHFASAGDTLLTFDQDEQLLLVEGDAPPRVLHDLRGVGADSPYLSSAAFMDGQTYFLLHTSNGEKLWVTDGTSEGTHEALTEFSEIENLLDIRLHNDVLYLLTEKHYSSPDDCSLWRLGGTASEPVSLIVIPENLCHSIRFEDIKIAADGKTYFQLNTGSRLLLYGTDGTPAGTFRAFEGLTEVQFLGSVPTATWPLISLGDSLYFIGQRFFQDRPMIALWRYRLNQQAPQPLHRTDQVATGSLSDDCSRLGVQGERLVFSYDDGVHGCELWDSDGTPAGTHLVEDIAPGFESSNPREFTTVGTNLYFQAADRLYGRELRVYDSSRSVRLVHDLFPGPRSSEPKELTLLADHIVFSADDGLRGRELWSLPVGAGSGCQASATALCLQDGRFRVHAFWEDFSERIGDGIAVPLTSDTGLFWFFNPDNIELAVKVLDGNLLNEHFWTFYGALSNVGYALTVADSQTGATRRYRNTSRFFASVGDTRSFGPLGFSLTSSQEASLGSTGSQPLVEVSQAPSGAEEGCQPSPNRLCLQGGRFAVEAAWEDFSGQSGVGAAEQLTSDTGYLWFFRETNVELLVKVLDGQAANGHHWVFYGSLSNVNFDLTVTDTQTGVVRTYLNRGRSFASVGDTLAFPQ